MSIQVFNKNFINLHFVARAINLKHDVMPLTRLYADQENIVGTDGHRLHLIANTLELAPGLYHVVKRTKTELHLVLSDALVDEYPNFKRLFPDDPDYHQFNGHNEFGRYAQVIRTLSTYTINFDYFRDSDPLQFDHFSAADDKPLLMESDNGNKVLIMPMRGEV